MSKVPLNNNKKNLLFYVILLFQFLLFISYYIREVNPFHPEGWDQVGYYNNSFILYNLLLEKKFNLMFDNILPQGVLIQFFAAISYLFTGVSKLNPIIIILLLWIFTQYILYNFAKNKWGFHTNWVIVGLFLSTNTYYFLVGGLADFRLDVAGSLVFGISLVLLLESDCISKKRETNLFIIFLIVAVLIRTNLMIIYLPILFFIIGYAKLINKVRIIDIIKMLEYKTIFSILLLCSYLFIIKKKFYDYYIHPIFNQKNDNLVQTMHEAMGVNKYNLTEYYLYYINNLFKGHFGILFVSIAFCFILMSAICFIYLKNRKTLVFPIVTCLAFILVPLFLYTFNDSKNPIIATTVVIPTIILLMYLYSILLSVFKINTLKIIGSLVLMVGVVNFLNHMVSTRGLFKNDNQVRNVAFEINNLKKEYSLKTISFLDFNEFNYNLLQYYGFLDFNKNMNYQSNLPVGFNIPDEKEIVEKLNKSDIVLLNANPSDLSLPVAFNKNIKEYNRFAASSLRENFMKFNNYQTPWGSYELYLRKNVKFINSYPDWLTKEFNIKIPKNLIGKINNIVIEGNDPTYLNSYIKERNYHFDIVFLDQNQNELIRSKSSVKYDMGKYTIDIQIPSDKKQETEGIKIYTQDGFIPKKIGLNEDTRFLVLPYPSSVNLK